MLILEAAPLGGRQEEGEEPAEAAPSLPFSEDDKRLMKSFKIRMD
jgi:hypothetical protein